MNVAMARSPLRAMIFSAVIASAPQAYGQTPTIQSQEVNRPSFIAELIEARRSDGILSLKIRLKNTGSKADHVPIYSSRNVSAFYVQAESKKYFVLQDTEKVPLTNAWDSFGALSPSVAPGSSYTWWAKYPAPPASVKKISFYWPLSAPFDDVPITDK